MSLKYLVIMNLNKICTTMHFRLLLECNDVLASARLGKPGLKKISIVMISAALQFHLDFMSTKQKMYKLVLIYDSMNVSIPTISLIITIA